MNFLSKYWKKMKGFFKQGRDPKQMALSITLAIVVSLFPIFGISTIVLTSLSLKYKLNLPIMIALSYVAEPLKAILFIPFITIGEEIFGTTHTLLNFEAIKASYALSFWKTAQDLSYELLCGFMGWLIAILPISFVFYFLLKEMLKLFDKYYEKHK